MKAFSFVFHTFGLISQVSELYFKDLDLYVRSWNYVWSLGLVLGLDSDWIRPHSESARAALASRATWTWVQPCVRPSAAEQGPRIGPAPTCFFSLSCISSLSLSWHIFIYVYTNNEISHYILVITSSDNSTHVEYSSSGMLWNAFQGFSEIDWEPHQTDLSDTVSCDSGDSVTKYLFPSLSFYKV